ncbi:MAG TPA: PepSY domain-containing protein, partial [Bacteroides coprosuis]|nr:PepSY domain-containing protein [Bacteroides coprosuis]
APFGKRAISGFSKDFKGKECIVEYENGSNFAEMPNEFRVLPMSLWNVALEVHTGRIYTLLGSGTLVFITFAGLIVFWVLISGYIIRKKKK